MVDNYGIILYYKNMYINKKKIPYVSYLFFFLLCYPEHTFFFLFVLTIFAGVEKCSSITLGLCSVMQSVRGHSRVHGRLQILW